MSAVWLRFRNEARGRWRAWLGVALLVGIAGGLVTSIVAGGVRADSAYQRMLAVSSPSDVGVIDSSDYGFSGTVDLGRVVALPQVDAAGMANPLFIASGRADGRPFALVDLLPIVSVDDTYGNEVDRLRITEGRAADPERADEAVLGFEGTDRLGLGVGSEVELDLLRPNDFLELTAGYLEQLGPRVSGEDDSSAFEAFVGGAGDGEPPFLTRTVRIVGVAAAPGEFPPLAGNNQPYLHLTPAFGRDVGDVTRQTAAFLRIDPAVPVAAFKREAERVAGDQNLPFIYTREDQSQAVERTIHVQAMALWGLAALVGLAAGLILTQLLVRQARSDAGESAVLRSLGYRSGQLTLVDLLRSGVQGVVAAAASLAVALVLVPAWSYGLARVADPDQGVTFDGRINGLGMLATFAFLVVIGVAAGWRAARPARFLSSRGRGATGGERRVRGARGLPRPLAFGVGVRQALDPGRGDRSVPSRSAVVSAALGVAVFTVAAIFGASLGRVVDTPPLYGWTWDLQVGTIGAPDLSEILTPALGANPDVAGLSVGTISQVQVEGTRVDIYAMDDTTDGVGSRLLEGRDPRAPDEIVLGTKTLDTIDAEVGDRVFVGVAGEAERLEVVGRAVFPSIGDLGQLGTGGRMTFEGLRRLVEQPARNVYLVRYRDGADPANVTAGLQRALDPYPIVEAPPPEDLANLNSTTRVPLIAGLALAGLAVATLVHALLTSARRRRGELGALRAIGFERGQVRGLFAGQATALALGALLVGLPLGLLFGRWVWTQVALEFGAPAAPVVPWVPLVALAVAVPVIANLVALYPGWRATRRPAATALRAE